jgi:ABC-2 type transport system ATP-binding protein
MTTVQEATAALAASESAAALELTCIAKSFDKVPAVDGISWTVRRGEFVGLLGPNGAGKTTLISIIAGLVKNDSGQARVLGLDTANEASRVKGVLGVVPQDLAIYPELSARENLRFFGAMYGLRGRELKGRVDDALRRVGLVDRAERPSVGKFSGAQKRRLNIAAALLHRPEILILDEPTVGVGPQSRNYIFDTLRELNDEGMTIVYVTHYMEEVEALCRTVAIVDHGRIIEEGPLDEVLARHGSSLVRLTLRPEERRLAVALLEKHPKVTYRITGDDILQISARALQDAIALVTTILTDIAPNPETCQILPPSLETVFIELTGNQLRDP